MSIYDITSDITGAVVKEIWWSEGRLVLVTEDEAFGYEVEGDCCSYSYFFDFYGVEKLLAGNPVTKFEAVDLQPGDPGYLAEQERYIEGEDIQVYGFRFTTEDPKWGEVTSVLSFRNASNGYYGGWMYSSERVDTERLERLTADKVGA